MHFRAKTSRNPASRAISRLLDIEGRKQRAKLPKKPNRQLPKACASI